MRILDRRLLRLLVVITCLCAAVPAARSGESPHQPDSTRAAGVRAVWIHAGMFATDRAEAIARLQTLLEDYRAARVTVLFCFDSLPAQHRKGWDFLATLVTEAHTRGIQVHPVISPGYPVPLEGEIRDHPEWLITGMKGEIYRNLNLANPAVRRYIVRVVEEALKYQVDGIHLDYARFPLGQTFSYDRETTEAFKKEFGQSPLEVSHDSGNMVWCEWIKWNARQVTTLVREIRSAVKARDRSRQLSAAVFPNAGISPFEIGQDWAAWAREGLVDLLCPMLYSNDTRLFREYVRDAVRIANGKCAVYAGVACSSSHNKNTPEGLLSELSIAGEEGAAGVAIFSGYSLEGAFLQALK
jgi:uncharacterized lipoprotein YddW (UPF0748 family)